MGFGSKSLNLLGRVLRILTFHTKRNNIGTRQSVGFCFESHVLTTDWLTLKMREGESMFRKLRRISFAPDECHLRAARNQMSANPAAYRTRA